MKKPRRIKTIEERLWKKTEVRGEDECWPWQGRRDACGYGQFVAYGSSRAHRVAYRIVKGEIPAGQVVRHHCDNPPCCNPKHLEAGTVQDNADDCKRRNRLNTSFMVTSNPNRKLTDDQVRDIRKRHVSGTGRFNRGNSYILAAEHGVTVDTIGAIAKRRYRQSVAG